MRAVVTDMMMPGMSGDAMIAALRARGIDVPILAVSGADTAAPLSAGPGLMRLALEQAMRASTPPQAPPPPPRGAAWTGKMRGHGTRTTRS
ncbi:response regulator [Luteitalea sp.]|uniref:response regulator n=1 Tax=Luteitalea sp. TaxID=2004800 RepID=UPI0025C2D679|nr:response regulator [Luteitalea sp.]